MAIHLDLGHAVQPHLAGSFAVARPGSGGNEAGNQSGSGRGGTDTGSTGNHRGGNSHGNGGSPSRGEDGLSRRNRGSADKDANSGVRGVSRKRTDPAQPRAATPALGLHGPAQGPRPTLSESARDMRVKPQRAQHSLVASGLTEADLAKLTARGFRIQARTKGSLIPRTVRLRTPHGLSLDQARRAVHKINPYAVVDFDTYYYADGEMPAGTAMETPGQSPHSP
jgi:hypothetical protein